jgi:hypothetical protein
VDEHIGSESVVSLGLATKRPDIVPVEVATTVARDRHEQRPIATVATTVADTDAQIVHVAHTT